MTDLRESPSALRIRPMRADDAPFILDLASRFTDFELPAWRTREACTEGVRADLERHLRERPEGSHFFIAELADGRRAGFMHLQMMIDFFDGGANVHVSDLAAARGMDGLGVGSALLGFAEAFARERDCRHLTLGVFPGNARARALYERHGFGVEMLRMVRRVG